MKNIHVTMLLHSYYPIVGGAERQLQALLPLLRECGVQSTVLTRRYTGLSAFEIVEGTPVYRLLAIGPKPLAAMTFVTSALLQIAKLRPDVIHAYDLMSPTSAAMTAKKFYQIPVIAKVLSGGPKGDVDRIRHRPNGNSRLRSIASRVDKFIVISSEIEKELIEIGATKDKFAYIPNGVDLERYSPAKPSEKQEARNQLNLPANSDIVLYVGRVIPEKRPEHLLAIWDEIHTLFPKALLVLVGDGSELNRLRNLNVKGVIFAGQVANVQTFLQAADIFVLPSAREGLSNALLEALASGLPVISTAIGAAPELIEDQVNGLLVNVDDTQALRSGILNLLGDKNLQKKFSIAGYIRMLKNYSLQSTANQLASLYHELSRKD